MESFTSCLMLKVLCWPSGPAAGHCCHDRHHPGPAQSSVVMVMIICLQGGSLRLQYFRDAQRQLEEVKVRERERERVGTDSLLKGQVGESDSGSARSAYANTQPAPPA